MTSILRAVSAREPGAIDVLLELVYDDLRDLAVRHMRGEPRDHTLQPTALVHEAYLRLVDQRETTWQDRAHFLSVASRLIRRILVDHARHRMAVKRGGGLRPVAIERVGDVGADQGVDLVALDEVLGRLEARNPQQASIVEMRFFAGLSIEEIATVLEIGKRSVDREWSFARAWLYRELGGSERGDRSPD